MALTPDGSVKPSLCEGELVVPRFKVAHLREQGQDMLLFPLDSSVHHKSNDEKRIFWKSWRLALTQRVSREPPR